MTEEKGTYQVKPYEEVVTRTMNRIASMQNDGQIHFPGDYSPQNALQSAWLILQEVQDKNDNFALDVCTKSSIANALLDMVVQGLNPAKDQCYFIVRGKTLCLDRSYFGAMTLAKRVDKSIVDIIAEVVFEDDVLEYEIVKGYRMISKHTQKMENVKSGKIKGAYCMIIGENGEVKKTDLMTWEEILSSWKRSITHPVDDNGNLKPTSNHAKQPVEFCRRTVINRACKPIINSSSDKTLLESVNRSEFIEVEETAADEIKALANNKVIDIEPEQAETQAQDKGQEARESPKSYPSDPDF